MKIAFRWKLIVSYLLLALAMGATIYAYLTPKLESSILAETREGLLGEVRLARLTAARDIRDLHRDSPAVATAIAAETRARVTVISTGGEVLGDSQVKPDDLKD